MNPDDFFVLAIVANDAIDVRPSWAVISLQLSDLWEAQAAEESRKRVYMLGAKGAL